ncbi:MAG: hypothetical protein H7Y15_01430 [Pseudonocardia sp.]|nr:hypothetical protein [Pseudonocardia sp.]
MHGRVTGWVVATTRWWAGEPPPPVQPPDLQRGGAAPGLEGLQDLVNYVAVYALVGCVFALVAGGLTIVVGGRLGFQRASELGRYGILAGVGVAFLVGIAAALVNVAYAAGAAGQ